MSIKLSYLENFLIISKIGSFSKSADHLDISQSAISQQMETLESYFDTKLFKRSTKGVSLTETGEILLKRAKIIVDQIKLINAEIGEKELRQIIKISASTIPGEHILPKYYAKFKSDNPNAEFQIDINDTATSFNKLFEESVDFAAVGSLMGHNEKIDRIILTQEELVLAIPKDHKLASEEYIDFKEILKYPYISREPASGTRIESEKLLKNNGIAPEDLKIICELTTTESVLSGVADGMGISIISSIAAKKMEAAGLVKILKPKDYSPKRKLFLVKLRQKSFKNQQVEDFWDFVEKEVSKS
jgi:DNA-binding transcriptional LysR family regulator